MTAAKIGRLIAVKIKRVYKNNEMGYAGKINCSEYIAFSKFTSEPISLERP